MIKLNKMQVERVITKFRPDLTGQKIKFGTDRLRKESTEEHQSGHFYQQSINAVLNEEPLPWE